MAQHFRISTILSDEHWAEFLQLLGHRKTTADVAHAWLTDRDYKLSRSAVGNFMQAQKSGSLYRLRVSLGIGSDNDARRIVGQIAAQLPSRELMHLTLTAAYLLKVATAIGESLPAPIDAHSPANPLSRPDDPSMSHLPASLQRGALERRLCVEELRKARIGRTGKMKDWLPSFIQEMKPRFPTLGLSQAQLYLWDRLYTCPAALFALVDHRGGNRRSDAARAAHAEIKSE